MEGRDDMKYIWKNICSFLKKETGLFCLCLICIFLSSQLMLTAYGIYGCYTKKKLTREMDMNSLDLELSETGTVTKGEFSEAFLACPPELTDGIDMILAYVKYTEKEGVRPLELRFTVREGKISSCSLFAHNLEQNRMITEYFSEEQEEKGEAVALVYNGMDQEIQGWLKDMENPDGTLSILGKEYEVIGSQSWAAAVLIPYQSLEDDTALYNDFGILLYFHDPVTREQYNQLKETLTAQLGDRVIFPEREIYDFNQLYLYNTILLINGFILLAAALNFALLYRYILMKRKKNLAVFQLCGLTRLRAACYYLGECILLLVPVIPLAFVCFRLLVLPALAKTYADIWSLFPGSIYGKFGAAYLVVSLLVLVPVIALELNRQTLKEQL